MRKLGYILLILGALYFAFLSFYAVLEAPIYVEHCWDQLLSPPTWTRGQIVEFSQTVLTDFAKAMIFNVLIGAALMLCGGICLDIAGWRKRA